MKPYRHVMLCLILVNLCAELSMGLVFPIASAAQEKGSGPIVITGDALDIDSKNKIATYRGNVKVVQGKTTMFSDVLMMSLDVSGKQLKQAVATGNLRLVNDTITATGDEGTFYNQEQKIEIEGKAKVWQGNNAISADRIVAYLGQKILEGYSSGSGDRATMTIYSTGEIAMPFGANGDTPESPPQSDATPSASETAEPTTDASETGAENASPITIVADSLRLDNSAQQGRFTGNVTVVKDATQLYADEMLVYITALPDGGNDVSKIEVFGHVKIINETQTITGDKGFFLNQEQYAKIEGDPGKKARIEDTAQNLVLEAPVVEIDLATSKVTAKKDTQPQAEKAEGGSERIRMEFGTDDTQSLFGTDAPEKDAERFLVTEMTLENLQKADVPAEIIEDVALLQNREFSGQEEFIKELEKRIGAENADKYKKLLLKYSKVEDTAHEQNLPSVTIQPDTISTSQD